MEQLTAVRRLFAAAFKFEGRATRLEFFQVQLLACSVVGVLFLLYSEWEQFGLLLIIASIACGFSVMAATVRRLHDLGVSPWWIVLLLFFNTVQRNNPDSDSLETFISIINLLFWLFLQFLPGKGDSALTTTPDAMKGKKTETQSKHLAKSFAKEDSNGGISLHVASEKNETKTAPAKTQTNINAKDKDGYTPLHRAVSKGEINTTHTLIQAGANINAKGRCGNTPLHWAMMNGKADITLTLVKAGADVNLKDEYGRTPLHVATKNEQAEIIAALIKAGADVNGKNSYDMIPLHVAAENGHTKTALTLIKAGADVNAKGWGYDDYGDKEYRTPLHLAVKHGQTDTISALVKAGADVNEKDGMGYTLLHWAVQEGKTDTVIALIKAGADVNAEHSLFLPPTCGRFYVDGVSVDMDIGSGETPLHLAKYGGHNDIALALIKAGANTKDDKTPLHWAALQGKADIVFFLITMGADVNAKDGRGNTPLHSAVQGGAEVAAALLKAGADVNAQADFWGWTPLHRAASSGNTETAIALINAGADVNAEDKMGGTPLHVAAGNRQVDTVRALVKAGAHLHARDDDGNTPLQKATQGLASDFDDNGDTTRFLLSAMEKK